MDLDEHCADLLTEAKKKHPFKVMWEAPASAISELTAIYAGEGLDGLRRRLKGVDLFSTNKPESFEIFGVSTVEEAIARYQALGMRVYYRVGTKGAYCEGFDLLKSCIVGNVVAAYNVRQYGPYPNLLEEDHQEMMAHVERIYRDIKKKTK